MGSTRIGRVIAAMVGVAVIALTVVVPASVAGAHGVVDQQSGSPGSYDYCVDAEFPEESTPTPIRVGQTFVPTVHSLFAVDVVIPSGPESGSWTMTVREGGPDGGVMASTSFAVTNAGIAYEHVHFDPPVSLVPNETYAFEYSPASGDRISYCVDQAGYSAGAAYVCGPDGCESPEADLIFRTFTNSAPPDTTIDSGPADGTTASTAVFEFSGTDDVTPAGDLTFECSVDGGAFAACESGDEFDSFGVGTHTFAVRAIDGEGQIDPTPAEYTWRVEPADSGPPPGRPEATSTTTSTTVVPERVEARAATPARARPTFAG